jgi:hypothetical protein
VPASISPDRWEQIRTTFEEIVDLEPAKRERQLASIGAKDPELRSTLEALLQADARANAVLEPIESPLGFVPPTADELALTPNGDVVLPDGAVTRRRWLVAAVSVVVLGAGGFLTARELTQRAANAEADWQPPAAALAPATASNLSLVAVNLRGEERPLAIAPSENAGSWAPTLLDTAYYAWPKISPDGKRIALEVRTGDQQWDVWIYDLTTRKATRLTYNFTGVRPFGWSRDSRFLIYLGIDEANITGPHRVVAQRWDGSTPPRDLLRTSFPIHDITFGPLDGYAVIREMGNDNLWIASLRTWSETRPLVATSASEMHPRLSPDGQLLAYASDASGDLEVYVQPMTNPSQRVQVSLGGGSQPVWSPDGRFLFYRGDNRLMRAAVRQSGRVTIERVDTLFADIYERHNNVTNYDVLPGGNELVMIRAELR